MEQKSTFDRINEWMRTSILLKLITIGFITLIMMIPTSMIMSLIRDRQNLRDNVTAEVSSKWGQSQVVFGPVISIPFTNMQTIEGKTSSYTEYAHIFPDELNISGNVSPIMRNRGIYNVMLYSSKMKLQGNFNVSNSKELKLSNLQWDKAQINLGIKDLKGIKTASSMTINGKSLGFQPGINNQQLFGNGMHINIPIKEDDKLTFDMDLDLNGSQSLRFVPIGKTTQVTLNSKWENPSFVGDFLPENPKVTKDGFNATWKVLNFNRSYGQQGIGSFVNMDNTDPVSGEFGYAYASTDGDGNKIDKPFGVRLLLPVDEYQKNNRSVKYAIMLIILTFTTFFFIEILSKKRFHPIQYLLVGFTIVLFYISMLSLSEHIHFNTAYWISCAITLGMTVLYSKAVFQNMRIATIVFGIMGLFYLFFYSILQLEDYALLMGSAGLIIILASVMYITRNIDWYSARKD
jgi:inner membrane protein